ncbi:hypothetical protein TIFTF001_045990 [Ficus carica]|uniref:Uncharacterized protein n=1 Tax=Ficus carica TaxID=3494 RepID=A0AA87YZZ0_FICCA|nr:hypothetical protein TIFTF001_045990 [Ficus carica]
MPGQFPSWSVDPLSGRVVSAARHCQEFPYLGIQSVNLLNRPLSSALVDVFLLFLLCVLPRLLGSHFCKEEYKLDIKQEEKKNKF